jgi:hypothetical protein
MHFVQQCASTHGNLAAQKLVVEQRCHRPAQKQILFNLTLCRPRDSRLMG